MGENEVFSRTTSALALKKDMTATYIELDEIDNVSGRPTSAARENAIQAWPREPRPLVLVQEEQILWTIFDIVLIALPFCLLVKIGLCIYAHHSDKDNSGVYIDSASLLSRGLIRLNEQLVTLFTIVFVTIMSTFVKRYALWKAQQGACISDLEQLQGSVSLPSTLKLIWSLRSFGVKSLILAIAWSFYYLGSQAVKLEYQLSPSEDFGSILTVSQRPDAPSYFDPSFQELVNQWESQYEWLNFPTLSAESQLALLNIKFGSVILEEREAIFTKDDTLPNPGTNNGAIVPDYEWTLKNQQQGLIDQISDIAEGWRDTARRSKQQYMSLAGHALWVDWRHYTEGIWFQDSVTSQFLGIYTLHNISYLNVDCSSPTIHSMSDYPNGTHPDSVVSFNMTSVLPNAPKDHYGYPLRQFDYWHQAYAVDLPANLTLTDQIPWNFSGTLNYTSRAFLTSCNLTTSYVDMNVVCISTGCYANQVRWANHTSAADSTGYSTPFDNAGFAENFLSNFVLSTGNLQGINSTTIVEEEFFPTENFNTSYWSALGPAHQAQPPNLLINRTLSRGLTLGFNTYYMLSQSVLSANALPDIEYLQSSSDNEDVLFKLIRAHGALLNQAYRIYWQWIPVDIVACSLLLAASIGAYWLRINTLAPDLFGYVSSLTRDNPYIHLPTEGSALSGVDRARMLRGMKVKIADVQSGIREDGSVGRIGLVPLEADVRPLCRSTRYV